MKRLARRRLALVQALAVALVCLGVGALLHRLLAWPPTEAALGAAVAGLVAALALSALSLRWDSRRLRQLSQQARQLAPGQRLEMTHADDELAALVEAFNLTLDELEQAHRQSEGFSADVAHELRSPLATLIGGTQLVLSRPRTAAELKEALHANLEELEGFKTLVNDMLFLARADQGERAQSLERQDLGALADATLDYCAALLDEAGLTARCEGAASAVCNGALIRRAMANLLSNAIQHASGARRITLHLRAQPGKVRVWVFNSGEPLAPEVAARMFDRFYRANEARTDQRTHHGLGLAIVRAVARMHGGRVFAEAQADGNAIGFEIPSALASEQRRVRDPAHTPR